MSDIEIDIINNPTPEIELDNISSGTPEILIENSSSGTPEVGAVALYGPQGPKGEAGPPGPQGENGNGIESIEKTSTDGYIDTYTINYTNGDTSTFDVTNGVSPTYIHEQSVASSVWNIEHNLNKINIRAVIIDSAGTTYHPSVTSIDENNCKIELLGATTGKAYIN